MPGYDHIRAKDISYDVESLIQADSEMTILMFYIFYSADDATCQK